MDFSFAPVQRPSMLNTKFPSWMPQQPNIAELRGMYRGIQKQTDDSLGQLSSAYGAQMAGNEAAGKMSAAAAARAAQNRAMQNGGSVAASFAKGNAMLPIYRQNNEMMTDLASKRLAAQQAAMQMRSGLAGAMADARQRQTGIMSDYANNEARTSLAGQGLDLNQKGMQLDWQKALMNDANQKRQMDIQGREVDLRGMIAALQNTPTPMGSWSMNNAGDPNTAYDWARRNEYQQKVDYRQGLVNRLANSGGGSSHKGSFSIY